MPLDREKSFSARHPNLMQMYNAIPAPPQQGAPIDYALPYMSPMSGLMPLLMQILEGLQPGSPIRSQASAALRPTVYDQFGEPVEPSIKTALNAKGVPQQFTSYPTPEFPPPGLSDEETVAWALANPPPLDQRLPDPNVTTVAKTPAMPLPTRNPGLPIVAKGTTAPVVSPGQYIGGPLKRILQGLSSYAPTR